MAFILNIDGLTTAFVQGNADAIQAYIANTEATADVTKGTALYDLLIRPAATMQSIAELNVNRARLAGSLLSISENPEIADTEMVDEVLSNYRVTRRTGTIATGQIEILLSSNSVTAIPSGSAFVSGSLYFYTTSSFVGVPSSDLVTSASTRLIKSAGTGVYSFLVDVAAATAGSEYQLSQGTSLSLQTPPSNYVSASAAYDFSMGVGAETNREIMARMPAALANRTPGNRTNVDALIQESFTDVTNVSVIGYGDPEMSRDQDNLFLCSYGGKSDIYVQTEPRPVVTRLTKSATLVSASGLWQISFNRDEFAGVYKVVAVIPTDRSTSEGSLTITSDARSISTSTTGSADDSFVPKILTYTQGAFSRYQTCVIEFLDPYTSTTGLTPMSSTQDYYVDILVLKDIASIQDDIFSNTLLRAHRYDDLVRAPIPCLVSMTIGLHLNSGDSVTISAVQSAIADRINQLGFRSSLSASYAINAAQGLLSGSSYVIQPIDMIGELVDPSDGSSVRYRSATNLVIPDNDDKQISKNTVMFFCDPGDISVYTESD